MAGIYVETKLRPCHVRVKGGTIKRALFHGWDFISEVVEPSPMIGGHPGGTVTYTRAIVELESGHITTVMPESIKFLDNKFDEYCWDEKGE